MSVIPWTEIVSFANIKKFVTAYPENLNGNSVVTYRGKVKLHGSNCAVQIHEDGTLVCQSRTSILTPEDDYAGFAKWVKQNEAAWKDNHENARASMIVYGEWVGPGVQKGVAVSEIPKKCFAVFAARPLDGNNLPLGDFLYTEPHILEEIVAGIPDTYVLPWYKDEVQVDWTAEMDETYAPIQLINRWVDMIEENDPWVEDTFKVKGTGEGLVFYPVSNEHLGVANFNNLVFKAKGEKHRVVKAKAAVQVSADVAANVDQFVAMVLTEARLEQGAAGSYEKKDLGKFLQWITADVQKETKNELEASGLTWEQVNKPLTTFARTWYLGKSK